MLARPYESRKPRVHPARDPSATASSLSIVKDAPPERAGPAGPCPGPLPTTDAHAGALAIDVPHLSWPRDQYSSGECGTLRTGDNLVVDGVKQHELLFDAEEISSEPAILH